MIGVVALEVQEKIEIVDAAFTWPHPTDKGYFVSAIFVRTNKNKPYLFYCPRNTTAISIDEETFDPCFLITTGEDFTPYKKITLTQQMTSENKDVLFYVFYLGERKPKEIKKENIERMFDVKVVD